MAGKIPQGPCPGCFSLTFRQSLSPRQGKLEKPATTRTSIIFKLTVVPGKIIKHDLPSIEQGKQRCEIFSIGFQQIDLFNQRFTDRSFGGRLG